MSRATTSLPVPVSPQIATGASLFANFATRRSSKRIAGLSATTVCVPRKPRISGTKPHTSQLGPHRAIGSTLEHKLEREGVQPARA